VPVALHDLRGALESLTEAVDILRVTDPTGSPQFASALFHLGDALRLDGRLVDGLHNLEEAQAIWQKQPPRNASDLADLDAALTETRAALQAHL